MMQSLGPTVSSGVDSLGPSLGAAALGPSSYEEAVLEALGPGLVDENDEHYLEYPDEIRGKQRFQPVVVCMIGRRGAGKSSGATMLAHILDELNKARGVERPTLSNMEISFAVYHSPYLLEDVGDMQEIFREANIVWDEVVEALPSSRTTSTVNLLATSFFRQIRKFGCEIIATTQFPHEISRSMVRQVDFFMDCQIGNAGNSITYYWFDWWGQYTGNTNIKDKSWPPRREECDGAFTVWGTRKVFDMYNTEEYQISQYAHNRDELLAKKFGVLPDKQSGPAWSPTTDDMRDMDGLAALLSVIHHNGVVCLIEELANAAADDCARIGQGRWDDIKLVEVVEQEGFEVFPNLSGDIAVKRKRGTP